MSFRFSQDVRVQHCDPAGTVFYPRYFEMLTICSEEWLAQVLGLHLSRMVADQGVMTPTLKISAEFLKGCRHGERLLWEVAPIRLGRSSCVLRYQLSCEGELRAVFEQTMVLTDAASRKSTAWSKDLRARLTSEMA